MASLAPFGQRGRFGRQVGRRQQGVQLAEHFAIEERSAGPGVKGVGLRSLAREKIGQPVGRGWMHLRPDTARERAVGLEFANQAFPVQDVNGTNRGIVAGGIELALPGVEAIEVVGHFGAFFPDIGDPQHG